MVFNIHTSITTYTMNNMKQRDKNRKIENTGKHKTPETNPVIPNIQTNKNHKIQKNRKTENRKKTPTPRNTETQKNRKPVKQIRKKKQTWGEERVLFPVPPPRGTDMQAGPEPHPRAA